MSRLVTDYRQDLAILQTRPQRWIAVIVAVAAIAFPFVFAADVTPPLGLPWRAWLTAANLALIASVGAVAFNLLLGYTHQVSVAHAAFLMLGSIVGAWLGTMQGISFWIILPVSAVIGAVVGAIVGIPALRFKGLYLLIATFGVHFFFQQGFKTFQVRNFGFNAIRYDSPTIPEWLHWLPFLTPDDQGQVLIRGDFRWYWVLLPVAILSILFMANVIRTREGRAFRAIAQHDVSASLIGINVTKTKLMAFAISSAFVTVTGVIGSFYLRARGEDSFPFEVVLFYAIMVIVGGFSTTKGAVFGAFFFYFFPVFFDWARADWPVLRDVGFLQDFANEINLAGFGILIMIVLVVRPGGLAGIWDSMKAYWAKWPFST